MYVFARLLVAEVLGLYVSLRAVRYYARLLVHHFVCRNIHRVICCLLFSYTRLLVHRFIYSTEYMLWSTGVCLVYSYARLLVRHFIYIGVYSLEYVCSSRMSVFYRIVS